MAERARASGGYSSEEGNAAVVIQRHYRGYAARRRVSKMKMNNDARWDDLVKQTGSKRVADQQLDNKNDTNSRWSRAVHAAARLQDGQGVHGQPQAEIEAEAPKNLDDETRRKRRATMFGSLSVALPNHKRDEAEELPYTSKALEQQHWLEMIDGKHRYGSNLKFYFRRWKEADTKDNFFRWLDRGDGKDLDLEELPRERLEKERIIYMSAEQRLNYLVKVDKDGLLRWAHNHELVDTAAGKWKDAGKGMGIVPMDPDEDDEDDEHDESDGDRSDRSSISDSYSADSSELHENADTHYLGLEESKERNWVQRKTHGITPAGIRKELLRKTVRRNTWIYVSDMKLNLFIGIKRSGNFQHSSFLAGGKVTSAGLIVVKRGLIKSLNPLSGHYRSSIEHFRAFIAQLEDKGADLSHVKIAKSVLTLWGLSKYSAVTKGQKDIVSKFKSAVGLSHAPTEAEKSAELQKNAEREEQEHQERCKAAKQAEEGQTDDAEKIRARREALYGKQRSETENQSSNAG